MGDRKGEEEVIRHLMWRGRGRGRAGERSCGIDFRSSSQSQSPHHVGVCFRDSSIRRLDERGKKEGRLVNRRSRKKLQAEWANL